MTLSATALALLDENIGAEIPTGEDARIVFALELDVYDLNGTAIETLYFSSSRYLTSPTDTPANVAFKQRLEAPEIDISFLASGDLARNGVRQIGSIKLNNPDGNLDVYLSGGYSWEGREAILKIGAPDWAYTAFENIAPPARVSRMTFTEEEITLDLNVSLADFDKPLQDERFAFGTVTIDDSSAVAIDDSASNDINASEIEELLRDSLEGRPKPLLYGRCVNVAPVLIASNYNGGQVRYQVHDGLIDAIETVYEGGLELDPSLYTVDLPTGSFTLHTKPVATVTADVRGAKTGSTWFDRPGEIVAELLETHVGLSASEIDSTGLTSYDSEISVDVGIYVIDDMSSRDALTYLMAPRGWWGPNEDGTKITGGYWTDPAGESATFSLTKDTVSNVARLRMNPPAYRVVFRYGRNWSTVSDFLGAVDEGVRDRMSKTWLEEIDEDVAVLTAHPQAREVTIETPWATFDSAEAADVLAIHKVRQDVYEVEQGRIPSYPWIGAIGDLSYDRFELDTAVNIAVVGTRFEPTSRQFRLRLWRLTDG